MKNVDIISRVVARKGETLSSSSKGSQKIDFSDYLLKSIWDKVFELKTDSQGTDYIFSKLPVVTQYGITMYSGDGVDIPSLASGLPFDGRTIWYNPDTNQIEVIGGTGGGSGEGVSNFWDLSGIPSWITISKPKYTYSEIAGTPDLSAFATQNWIISQGYASAEELKKYIPISGYTEVSGEKNFTGGLKVNGSPIYYDTEKKYWKLEGDLLVTGGVTMYGVDSTDIPSLINSLPVATTKEKGVAYFDPNFFSVSSDGKVSFIGETGGGLDITALQNYLTQNSYLNVTEGDNRYLKLSGGTLTYGLTISAGNLIVSGSDTVTNSLYPTKDNQYTLGNGARYWSNIYTKLINGGTPWTSVNDGSGSGLDADLLDGLNSSDFSRSFVDIGANNYKGNGLGYTYATAAHGGACAGGFISFGDTAVYGCQINGDFRGESLYFRGINEGSFTSWKQIAFTDSNVASATKLQTARTIWGQSFDGTSNVYGTISDTYGILPSKDSTYDIGSSSNQYRYVYASWFGAKTGEGLSLGSNNSTHISILSSGNVGIGTTSPTRKLDIVGSMSLTGEYKIGGYDVLRCYNNALEVGRETSFYQSYSTNIWGNGINFYNKEGNRLLAVTNGGNFGFGVATPTSKLHVSGDILATGGITTNDSVTINGIKLSKSKDGVLYLDGNLVVKGGVTMYGTDATSSPTLPIASTTTKGVAYFDSDFFSVGSDGKVTFIGKTDGFNVTELQNYLTQNSYLNTTSGDNRYLKLSGGTLSSSTDAPLYINRKGSAAYSNIVYQYNGVSIGVLGFGIDGELAVRNKYSDNINYYKIWHEGNDGADSGLDADMLDGRHSSGFAIYEGIVGVNVSSGVASIGYTYATQEHGGLYAGGFINFGVNGYFCQLNGNVSQSALAYRFYNTEYGKFSDWKSIAFTDSNVASATKLQKARTIWGKSFDGTSDVYGTISDTYEILPSKDSTYDIGSSSNQYRYVYASWVGAKTGEGLSLGSNNSTHISILSSGNVGIGTTSPTRKLDIVGSMSLTGEYKIGGYDVLRCYNSNLEIGRETSAYQSYGTNIWGNGISLYNQSGTQLLAVTSGGNFGFGVANPTSKLHVNGDIATNNYLRILAWSGYGSGSCNMWYDGNKKQLFVNTGASFSYNCEISGTFTVNGASYLHGDVFVEELNTYDVIPRRTDAYSCGNSSLRWYQMYSYIGDFSGAVNMGSTLNVTGMTTMTNATITGYLRLKDTTNYGRTIYFGDGELCYLEEASDDVLTIYANAGIKLNTSSTSYNVSINTNLLVSGGITMYSQRSLKNIQDERGLSLGELGAIKPIRYTWKDGRDNRIHFGGIADDIQQVLPEVVYKTNDGVLTMDYGNAAFAIASSLIKPVVDHEKRIAMLEEENKQLRQEVERLKSA